MTTFDSLAIARQLTDAGVERARGGRDRGRHQPGRRTRRPRDAGSVRGRSRRSAPEIGAVRTESATTGFRLIRWIIATSVAGAGIVVAAMR